MKISCQSCQAKYTIADDKVLGKIVKIRCKKCGATIVVNGNDPAIASASGDGAEVAHEDDKEQQEWTVNVADGDQRTMTERDIAAAYRSGVVNDETYCWRDGMADWATIREIPALVAACATGPGGGPDVPPMVLGRASGDTGGMGLVDSLAASAVPSGPTVGGDAPGIEVPKAAAAAASATTAATPMAARRAAGGRAPIADLFGGAAQAGGEDDVMTSAPAKLPQANESHDPQARTGARNENSVLFSLSALTGKSQPPPRDENAEASGLIDIRQLSAQLGNTDDKRKSSRVEDIMNLTGGGFSPALTAPVLSAPTIEPYAEPRPGAAASLSPGAGRNKGLVFLAVGVGALVIVGAVGGAMTMMRKDSDAVASASAPSSQGRSPAGSPDEPPSATAAAAPPQAPAASAAAPEPSASAAPTPETKEAPSPAAQAPEAKKSGAPAAKEAVAKAAAAAPESDQPFNMGEAKARLGAAAEGAQSCKKGDVTGTGHVIITFAPSGAVQSAAIEGPPFEGTPAGACVAAHFRAVRVPPFGGSPFKVRKSFTIN